MAGINIFPSQPSSINVVSQVANNPVSFAKDQTVVTAAGTPVQGPNLVISSGKQLTVMANRDNLSDLYVGNSAVSVANSTLRVLLKAGESVQFSVGLANSVWVDAAANGMVADFITEVG